MLDPVSISILTGKSNIFAGEMHIYYLSIYIYIYLYIYIYHIYQYLYQMHYQIIYHIYSILLVNLI